MHHHETDLNPLLEYDTTDAEQCPACDHVGDLCPYHRGLEDGRAMVAKAIAILNEDPERINGVLAMAQRRDSSEL